MIIDFRNYISKFINYISFIETRVVNFESIFQTLTIYPYGNKIDAYRF